MNPITEIRCSKLARPMECAGFLSFEGLEESEPGEPAREGTAAAELLERMLLGNDIPAQARNGVYFNDEMRFHLKPIVEEIRSKAGSDVCAEQEVAWQTRSGIWIKGKYDVSFVYDGRLYVDDLKYGWGIVEVTKNWQLLGYAIGEIIRRGAAYKEIVLRIRQPRPHHEDGDTREWVLTYAQLLDYKERIEVRMEEIANGLKTLTTSKQCKYCSAAAEACPAFNRLFYRALEVSTHFTQDNISEIELSRQMDHVQRAVEVIKIKSDSLTELAVSRIRQGKIVPGYVTEERYGDRKWKDVASPEVIKTLTGKDVLAPPVMLSPAQAEKIGIDKKFINQLVDRKFLGMKVVKGDASKIGDKIFGGSPT